MSEEIASGTERLSRHPLMPQLLAVTLPEGVRVHSAKSHLLKVASGQNEIKMYACHA
jgi:hypothetical protein